MSKLKAATGANKGQSNLFSFFKKPPSAVSVEAALKHTAEGSSPATLKTANPFKLDDLLINASPELAPADAAGQALVDKRIEVFWPKDNMWYAGTVGEYDPAEGSHTIAYEDGIVEVLNLDQEQYRLAEDTSRKRKLVEGADELVKPSKRTTAQKKIARRIGNIALY